MFTYLCALQHNSVFIQQLTFLYCGLQHVGQTCLSQLTSSSPSTSLELALSAEAPMDKTTATPLQYLLNQGCKGPGTTGLAIPSNHRHHQPTNMEPALANRPTSHMNGSHFFHAQEREFLFHVTSFFQIQIDIDLLHNPQAAGGSYTPP